MKKTVVSVCCFFAITFNCYAGGHKEYYTDANGFTHEKWVSDGNEDNTYNNGNSSGSNSYAHGAYETVKEAGNMMSNNGKAVWDKINNSVNNGGSEK